MKIYNTKYALTKGIMLQEAEQIERNPQFVSIKNPGWHLILSKTDWHYTKEQAIERANEMRDKKIISLKKQIKKLESMDFSKGI